MVAKSCGCGKKGDEGKANQERSSDDVSAEDSTLPRGGCELSFGTLSRLIWSDLRFVSKTISGAVETMQTSDGRISTGVCNVDSKIQSINQSTDMLEGRVLILRLLVVVLQLLR